MNSLDVSVDVDPRTAELARRQALDPAIAASVLEVVDREIAILSSAYLVEVAYYVEAVLLQQHRAASGPITEDAAVLLGHRLDISIPAYLA
ncbi:hypothetical protein BAY61_31775 (plasmid) [Prauserella marina]|uniref:Uncharacterized protein n=1 Tax=Prauserella marina TaxID=530584 RepID=A0A222W0Z8_9PSEU|nr:hypothetical protein [Prauserella marina]ASR39867.1 hypothetical protein BAY61_31775 [Prauserella marina]PWV71359.1 hypothetical protein DES30_11275 [Prauserella marina]SDD95846.1 hypothetical protein SAMN05421630_11537 [Prauserella marina]